MDDVIRCTNQNTVEIDEVTRCRKFVSPSLTTMNALVEGHNLSALRAPHQRERRRVRAYGKVAEMTRSRKIDSTDVMEEGRSESVTEG